MYVSKKNKEKERNNNDSSAFNLGLDWFVKPPTALVYACYVCLVVYYSKEIRISIITISITWVIIFFDKLTWVIIIGCLFFSFYKHYSLLRSIAWNKMFTIHIANLVKKNVAGRISLVCFSYLIIWHSVADLFTLKGQLYPWKVNNAFNILL